jgi:hypothetical protein
MAIHAAKKTAGRPSPQVAKANTVPAPIGGIDTRTILSSGDPKYAIYSFNLLPDDYGLRVRRGYSEWCIDLDNGNPLGIGTLVPFGGVDNDPADDRLFAVTNEGIWDVTTFNTPVLVLDFLIDGTDTSKEAGYGVYTQYTTDAAEQLLFYADSRNGLYEYSEATDLWIRSPDLITTHPTAIPPTSENIGFVTSHKKQLWFIGYDSSVAWYLPQAAITGEAYPFFFGSKFVHGGNLAGLFSWSLDAGIGLDDYLIAVSRAGDVIPYKGSDPSSADDWSADGLFFIGAVPANSRFDTELGGNLMLLSAYGLNSMSDLLQGTEGKDVNALTITQNIASLVRADMVTQRLERNWQVKYLPAIGSIAIIEPQKEDGFFQQYVMHTITTGWGIWRDAPINCLDEWGGFVYFGTLDGRVMKMNVDVDEVKITPDPENPINGTPIDFSILTTFQDFGEPALFKRGKYIRPQFVAQVEPKTTTRFRYDYKLDELTNLNSEILSLGSTWDVNDWDQAIWAGQQPIGFDQIVGGWGMGRNVAVAMRGNSTTRTTLVSWDVMWDSGAPI